MAKEKQSTAPTETEAIVTEFDMGEDFETVQPNQGLSYRRIFFGDYSFEVVGAVGQVSKTAKPHMMIKVTARVVAVISEDARCKNEIGSEITNYYGGSIQSPDFMRQRLQALLLATGVKTGKGGKLTAAAFIGKRFDASIVWELSKSNKLDDFGQPKMYANDRLKGERKVGAERPPLLNPAAESRKAMEWAEKDAGGGDAAPWDAGGDSAAVETTADESAPGFIPEEDVDGIGMAYRAALQLGSEENRETLIGAGIDPDGPVKIDLVDDPDLKRDWLAKFGTPATPATPAKKALPPLNGSRPKTGTRAPAAAR